MTLPTTIVDTTAPGIYALNALARMCDHRFSTGPMPDGVHTAWLAACGSATFPSDSNTARRLDAFDALSARHGISTDAIERWFEAHRAGLTLAVKGSLS